MSTQCTVTVRAKKGVKSGFTIFRHWDGYPDSEHGVIASLGHVLPFAWPLPRFEPDEFAAAIVATWKTQPGGVRLAHSRDDVGSTDYHYEVYPAEPAAGCNAVTGLAVEVFERADDDGWQAIGEARPLFFMGQAPA